MKILDAAPKPLPVQAIQWEEFPLAGCGFPPDCLTLITEFFEKTGVRYWRAWSSDPSVLVLSQRGMTYSVRPGDWIVKDSAGRVYPLGDTAFRQLYEVPDEPTPAVSK